MAFSEKNITLPICYDYSILGTLKMTVTETKNDANFLPAFLFALAARKNLKRGFLFVSKVLGKHIPVLPLLSLSMSRILAEKLSKLLLKQDFNWVFDQYAWETDREKYLQEISLKMKSEHLFLKEKTLFIGFAETATALGQGIFSCFAQNASYIHTTRSKLKDFDCKMHFAEEHSHAVDHYCYALNSACFDNEDRIVFVDDEMTTGKTVLNFIRVLQKKFPRKHYAVISILDWRSLSDQKKFRDLACELDILIDCVSLFKGLLKVENENHYFNNISNDKSVFCVDENSLQIKTTAIKKTSKLLFQKIDCSDLWEEIIETSVMMVDGEVEKVPFLRCSGRFGLNVEDEKKVESACEAVAKRLLKKRCGEKTLCLGTEEFMYIPMKIASMMGDGVLFQSTTRSPIYVNKENSYAVKSSISFFSVYDQNVTNFLYNVLPGFYDEVFVFLEYEITEEVYASLLVSLQALNFKKIWLVVCAVNKVVQ